MLIENSIFLKGVFFLMKILINKVFFIYHVERLKENHTILQIFQQQAAIFNLLFVLHVFIIHYVCTRHCISFRIVKSLEI